MHQGEHLKAKLDASQVPSGAVARVAGRTPSWVSHTLSRRKLKPETVLLFETALATCIAARQPKGQDSARTVGLILIEVGRSLLTGGGAGV